MPQKVRPEKIHVRLVSSHLQAQPPTLGPMFCGHLTSSSPLPQAQFSAGDTDLAAVAMGSPELIN